MDTFNSSAMIRLKFTTEQLFKMSALCTHLKEVMF